jgi:hypothetical protein
MAERQWRTPKSDGIRKHTSSRANQKIDRATQESLDERAYSPDAMRARLAELEGEWNIDRALMLNFAVLGGLSAAMAMRSIHRGKGLGAWAGVFATQIAFLAHHAIRRWCPPMPVFRRLGFRSEREIDAERAGLEKRLAELTTGLGWGAYSGPTGAA